MNHARQRGVLRVVKIRILNRMRDRVVANYVGGKQTGDRVLGLIHVVAEFPGVDAAHDHDGAQGQNTQQKQGGATGPVARLYRRTRHFAFFGEG